MGIALGDVCYVPMSDISFNGSQKNAIIRSNRRLVEMGRQGAVARSSGGLFGNRAHRMAIPAIRMTVIIFLGALSVVCFSALPILGYMAVAGAVINNMSATGPLVLFIGLPGAILAAFWWIGLRLTRSRNPSISHLPQSD